VASLGDTTWTTIERRAVTYVAVPIGSTEQHGPHLPVDTDTRIAVAIAESLAVHRPEVLVAPAIAISASGEHAGFAGTLSIGTAVLTQVLVEVARSADWARGVVFVNGHGGNVSALREAMTVLDHEQRRSLAWWPTPPNEPRADAHAGWLETSVMLHLAAHRVEIAKAEAGDTRSLPSIIEQLRVDGVRRLSPNGVLGDPTGATAEFGAQMMRSWQDDLLARFDNWVP
jgi:creatinine amidohydrolase